MKKNFQTVSRLLGATYVVLMIISRYVSQPQVHQILEWLFVGFGIAYFALVVSYYAKPSWYNNKVKEQPH